MTHTTTDAAEARAPTVIQADRDAAEAVYADLFSQLRSQGHQVNRKDQVTPDSDGLVQAFARHRLATAEAASGAGEREGVPQARLPANKCGAVSDDAVRHLEIRSPLNRAIYKAIRGYDMSNMTDADDPSWPYPLVDLMSNPAPSDIGTGEMEMVSLADEVECAVREALASLPPATDPAMGLDPATVERCAKVAEEQYAGTPGWSGHYQNAGTCIASAIRALAAAPTIPATGEVRSAHDDAAVYGIGIEVDGVAIHPGRVVIRRRTIPATGRAATEPVTNAYNLAATEGEGASHADRT